MRQDIHIRHSDIEAAGENLVDVLSNGIMTVQIGAFSTGATLYMSQDDATMIANRILDAVRASDELNAEKSATAPVCDHCGAPVQSDGDTGNEWWTHVTRINGSMYFHGTDNDARVTVNDQYLVRNTVLS